MRSFVASSLSWLPACLRAVGDRRTPSFLPLVLAALLAPGCGGDVSGGGADGLPGDGGGVADAPLPTDDVGVINVTDGPIPEGGVWVHDGSVLCVPRECQPGKIYACGDCLDNDGDGRIDSEDADCMGACQNNEGGFYGMIPGQNNAKCKADCYFDQDTGGGNDGCEWDHRCDPHEIAPSYYPEPESGAQCAYDPGFKLSGNATCAARAAMQPAQCNSFCGKLTPNGCDCFGCCVIPPSTSTTEGVYLGSRSVAGDPSCTLASAADPTKCHPCQIVPGCFKGCGRCQLCIGKTKVPDDCFGPTPDGGWGDAGPLVAPDAGVAGQCTGGEQPCGLPGQAACAAGYYCVTGCCQLLIS